MGLPIQSKSTQEGCNPISSNCVIWQGPDIPCINLCNGDSVSDVVAKLAEKLCTILDQTDISVYDLSCFNPLCPNPTDFQALIQVILDKICALENITPSDSVGTGCPDSCIVSVATCLQSKDFLGDLITTLPLKDYVIKIGNEICTILTILTTVEADIADLQERVAYIEANCCSTSSQPTVGSASCISGTTGMPIVSFAVQLETAFCALETELGTISTAVAAQCITNADPQLAAYPATTAMSALAPDWVLAPASLSETVQNLWVALCDTRDAVATLQGLVTTLTADLAACCAATCADIIWSYVATGIQASKNIKVYLSGAVPAGFTYCGGGTTGDVTVTDAFGASFTFTEDVLAGITSGTVITLDASAAGALTENSVHYDVAIEMCLTDGTLSCTSSRYYSFYNSAWCTDRNPQIASTIAGQVDVSWVSATTPSATDYLVTLYTSAGVFVASDSSSYTASGARTANFTGLTTGTIYKAVLRSTQNGKFIDCETSSVVCA